MIAEFRYSDHPPAGHITLRLTSSQGVARGRVEPPTYLVGKLAGLGVHVVNNDEYIDLALALSLAVLAATVGNAELTLTGDEDAWPEQWGPLRKVETATNWEPRVIAH
jgi:hypothetical protein